MKFAFGFDHPTRPIAAALGGGGDSVAPMLSSPVDAASGTTTASLSVDTDEDNGTLYWVVTTSDSPPSAAQVKAGQNHLGASAAASGSQAVSATGTQVISGGATGLTAGTPYVAHFMHEDAAANQSSVVSGDGLNSLTFGLVAYWNLDEASGQRNDSHTGALHLTDNNTVGASATGGPDSGQCADFVVANSEYFSRADNAGFAIGDRDWTIAGFFYVNSLTTTRGLAGHGGQEDGWDLLALSTGNVTFRSRNAADTGSNTAVVKASAYSAATWAFVLAQFTALSDTASLNVNNSGSPATQTWTNGTHVENPAFGLGARNGSGSTPHDGREAYWGIWTRILTAAEKTFLYNAGAGRNYAAISTFP